MVCDILVHFFGIFYYGYFDDFVRYCYGPSVLAARFFAVNKDPLTAFSKDALKTLLLQF